MTKTAVVLFNLGGPDSLEAVQPFLENLFNDPDIFKLPFQKSLARFISKKRAPKVQKEYALIGGKSPLSMWTEKQRSLLELSLRNLGFECSVFAAMRYWHPLTQDVTKAVEQGNYEHIILLPLYPHYSVSTTGSSYNEWNRYFKKPDTRQTLIKSYQTHPAYIDAVNARIDETLSRFDEPIREQVQLVFSAHGTPVSYVKKGDPYSLQIAETIKAIMEKRGSSHTPIKSRQAHHLCFQSKVGPMKWLTPATEEKIKELSQAGKKHLLIIPISFVSDHVETLFELGIEYRHIAEKCGIENYIVMHGMNDSPLFISALSQLVIENK